MGSERVTTQNVEVVLADADKGLIAIKGSVPGSDGGWVRITDAEKIPAPEGLPFPAATASDAAADNAVENAAPAEDTNEDAKAPAASEDAGVKEKNTASDDAGDGGA
jgi:large subunit ribosomal protein L3